MPFGRYGDSITVDVEFADLPAKEIHLSSPGNLPKTLQRGIDGAILGLCQPRPHAKKPLTVTKRLPAGGHHVSRIEME